jgi:hypothetical protein
MLSYHLLDHSIYCLPRVPNILDWTLRGGDARITWDFRNTDVRTRFRPCVSCDIFKMNVSCRIREFLLLMSPN